MDFLLPFVTSDDPKWRQDIHTYVKNFDKCRFRDYGTLKYLFRGVERNMSFIDRVVLIVAYPSQVPEWVNTDTVRIVTHEEIMPSSILPTFNSSTIECFINEIPDLSERFIYANDDMFPTGLMTEECFFREGRPVINFEERDFFESEFLQMCKNTNNLAAKLAGVVPTGVFLKPAHFHTPMIKSVNKEILRMAGDKILKSCSRFREPYNFNQYLYQDYYVYSNLSVIDEEAYRAKRISWNMPYLTDDIVYDLGSGKYDIYCINDEYWWQPVEPELAKITGAMDRLFPDKCRFEK